jgi:hypothetical protein
MTDHPATPTAAKSNSSWMVALVFLGLLFAGFAIYEAFKVIAERSASREKDRIEVADSLRKDLNRLAQSANSDGPISAIDTNATVGGELGELQLFVKTYMNKVISLQNDYQAELNAIGWHDLLDPERMNKDKNLAESKAIVARAGVTVEKYRQRWTTIFNETKASVDRMDTSSVEKRGFVKGFRESSVRGNAQAQEIWNFEVKIVATAEELVSLLAQTKGKWTVDSGQFVFSDQQTLDAFNGYVEKLNSLTAQEEAIRSQSAAAAQASLNKIDPR